MKPKHSFSAKHKSGGFLIEGSQKFFANDICEYSSKWGKMFRGISISNMQKNCLGAFSKNSSRKCFGTYKIFLHRNIMSRGMPETFVRAGDRPNPPPPYATLLVTLSGRCGSVFLANVWVRCAGNGSICSKRGVLWLAPGAACCVYQLCDCPVMCLQAVGS